MLLHCGIVLCQIMAFVDSYFLSSILIGLQTYQFMIMDNKEREGKHTNRKTNGDGKKGLLRG